MIDTARDTEKLRKIVSLLPGENCGKCGFENCGGFAVALSEGKAKPADCHKSLPSVKKICKVLGIEAPTVEELQAIGRHHGPHGHPGHHIRDGHHGQHGHHKHIGHHAHGMHKQHPSH